MCGIGAILKRAGKEIPAASLTRFRDSVQNRGPDDAGTTCFACPDGEWQPAAPESAWELALIHRRLSILDLSALGHQPMNFGGRAWVSFNGEIYNFIELRAELEQEGFRFTSNSDTEVILAAYLKWGEACFARLRGMWAMVLFDPQRNQVILSRDRLGIKPLYIWESGGLIAAVSEIKQLLALPGFSARLNSAQAEIFLRTGYEDQNSSFFKGVIPLEPGTFRKIDLGQLRIGPAVSYWAPETIRTQIGDPQEAARLFAEKFRQSVRLHLRSDVPVGCALSGGLDSSSIAVAVDELNGGTAPLNTFSCVFGGSPINEQKYIEQVNRAIRSTPHSITPSPEGFLEDLNQLVWAHDEPVGGLSIYASYCIARLTRANGVPVTLNGQGGDEILSGYWQSYFFYLRSLLKQFKWLKAASHFGGSLVSGNAGLTGQIPVMLKRYRKRKASQIQLKFAEGSQAAGRFIQNSIADRDYEGFRVAEIRELFLPKLLKWEDRNSMNFSVEGRYPFLDHELIELCLSFTPEVLHKSGWTKLPLRNGLKGLLPDEIRWRKSKFGFEVPQESWLSGALKPVFQQWLASDRPIWNYVERTYLAGLAQTFWQQNGGGQEMGQELFRAFMFDQWLEQFKVSG